MCIRKLQPFHFHHFLNFDSSPPFSQTKADTEQKSAARDAIFLRKKKKILKIQRISSKGRKTSISQKKSFISFHLLKTEREYIRVSNKVIATVSLWPLSTNFSLFW